jgi:hypothetical protein
VGIFFIFKPLGNWEGLKRRVSAHKSGDLPDQIYLPPSREGKEVQDEKIFKSFCYYNSNFFFIFNFKFYLKKLLTLGVLI